MSEAKRAYNMDAFCSQVQNEFNFSLRYERLKAFQVSGLARICHNFNVSFRALFLVGNTQMRTYTIAAIIAVLAVPAHAQTGYSKSGGKLGQKSDEQIAAEQQKKKNEENAYKDAIKKIPDQPVKQSDPWGNLR
jgi:hypothetical protein